MDHEDVTDLRDIQYRQIIATTNPSTELLLAQSASVRNAVGELGINFRYLVRERLVTESAVRRVFPRSLLHKAHGRPWFDMPLGQPMEMDESADAGCDTPMPDAGPTNCAGIVEQMGDMLGRDLLVPSPKSGDIAEVFKWDDGMPSTVGDWAEEDVQDPTTDCAPYDGPTNNIEVTKPLQKNDKKPIGRPVAPVLAGSAASGEKRPPIGSFLPQRMAACPKDADSSCRSQDPEAEQSMAGHAANQEKTASQIPLDAGHPLPPHPSSMAGPPSETVVSMEIGGIRHGNSDIPHAMQSEKPISAISGPVTKSDNDPNPWPAPLSPTPSSSTLAESPNNVHSPPIVGKCWDEQTMVDQPQTICPASLHMMGDSTDSDSDSDDDYEPGGFFWDASEIDLERFCGRVKKPHQVETTAHQLIEFDCRSWDWAGQIDRYIDFCVDARSQACDDPKSRVYFPQNFYDAIVPKNQCSNDSISLTGMPLSSTSKATGKSSSYQDASFQKPARGPDSLKNMIERRMLQFFKDTPGGAPITSSHIIRMWHMLEQTTEIMNQQGNKIHGFTQQPKQVERRRMFEARCHPTRGTLLDEDHTLLLRSKGMSSPLAEVISIDEKWPEGWEVTMTQPERFKIAGSNRRDPMKRLLESLRGFDKDD